MKRAVVLSAMVLLVFGIVFTIGCQQKVETEEASPASRSDYAFYNGKIYTVNEKQPWAEAVAVKDNKIVAVGSVEEVEKYVGGTTEVIDLDGKTMMPGFVSAHDHLISSNWTNAGVNLFSAKTVEECLKLIKEYAQAHPDHKVIKGIGWNVSNFGGVHPTAKQLDTAVPDRPALILDFTIHDAWLKTKALTMANVTKDTPDAVPGVTYWVRDKQGNPTGCAIEIQWMKAYVDIGAWEPKKMMKESADKLLTLAASNGTTTFLNPGVITPNIKDVHGGMETDFMAAMEMLTEMEKAGELRLRVNALPFFKTPKGDPKKFVAFTKKMSEKYDTDKIRVQTVRIHPEGNSTSAVAPFLESYSHKDTKGAFNVKPEVTKAIFLEANKAGLDVMIHTDGDASTRAAVDAVVATIKAGDTDRGATLFII